MSNAKEIRSHPQLRVGVNPLRLEIRIDLKLAKGFVVQVSTLNIMESKTGAL